MVIAQPLCRHQVTESVLLPRFIKVFIDLGFSSFSSFSSCSYFSSFSSFSPFFSFSSISSFSSFSSSSSTRCGLLQRLVPPGARKRLTLRRQRLWNRPVHHLHQGRRPRRGIWNGLCC